jgi:adenosylhomocysteine nucleosidase
VVRGAEESAVRRGLARAGAHASVAVHAMNVGPVAADAAAVALLAAGTVPPRVLVAGLCGGLSPALDVGDALFYSSIVDPDGPAELTDAVLTARIADTVAHAQTGIRALSSSLVVVNSAEKAALARRYDVDAVDMESLAVLRRLARAGSSVAVLRVVSDCVDDDLPDLNAAVDRDGALSGRALFAASVRRPGAAVRMALNGSRALAALGQALEVAAQPR